MENPAAKPNRSEKGTATAALLHAYLEHGEITARDRLIELYLPLVESFAHRYERTEDYDDLFQAGCIGLINAVDRFDLERGGELAAFAVPNIVGEIKRHLRDRTTSVRTPRSIQELRSRAIRCERELAARFQRRPTVAEVARELGVDKDEVARALSAERPAGDTHEVSLDDATPRDALDVRDERLALASAFEVLDERERQIVYLRFVQDKGRSEVAQELGISERHLSRQTQVALTKLREELERAGQGTVAPPTRAVQATASGQPLPPKTSARKTPRPPPVKRPGGRFGRRDSTTGSVRREGAAEPSCPPYHIRVVRNPEGPEGHEWTAHAEELPGCAAHGDSAEEAVRRIGDAIDAWIDEALATGREIPDPRTAAGYSGRLMLRMPRSLHADLSGAAEREGVSLNQFIASSLERALAAPAGAPDQPSEDDPAEGRGVPALLRLGLRINLIAVLVAGVAAVISVILILASQQGW
jgi:RNA polymerase sigma-B factor